MSLYPLRPGEPHRQRVRLGQGTRRPDLRACWKEWEGMEVKVINEYRLNFRTPAPRCSEAASTS